MPTPSRRQIRAGFETVINNFAKANNILIAFENRKLEPTTARYLRCFLLEAPRENMAICYGTANATGVFQIDIVGEINTGAVVNETLADTISSLFTEGTRVGGVRVVRNATQSVGQQEKERYVLSLSIDYSYI